MPEPTKRTNDLILRLTQDYIKSIRSRRMLSVALIIAGVITVIVSNLFFDSDLESVLKIISSATGLTISASSVFPINDVIKLNLKIRTLESLAADLEHSRGDQNEDTQRIEQIVWKLVEQTVTA